MRHVLILPLILPLILLLLTTLAQAQERAFVKMEVARDTFYSGEPILVRLIVGLDLRESVQMFRQRFDVPVQVEWAEDVPGASLRATSGAGVSFTLNGQAARAPAADGIPPYTAFVVERTYVATKPGALVIAGATVRYAYATKFKEDFVSGRVALDRQDASVRTRPVALTIRALPPPPAGFGGAVGEFSASATVSKRKLDVGEVFQLTLRIEGTGNRGDPPRLKLDGFHVYGSVEGTYDIAATRVRTEIPPIPFPYFDPHAGEYRTAHAAPIPLTMQAGPLSPSTELEKESDEEGPSWLWFVLPAGVGVAVGLWLAARRRPRAPGDAEVFKMAAHDDLAAAFTEFLAARLACSPAAVIGPDLAKRLIASDVPPDRAVRAAALTERLVAARYGGTVPDATMAAEAHALVSELE